MTKTAPQATTDWHRGSVWGRWDPHIHTPETLLADNYGKSGWDEFLERLEASADIVGLGITDYFCIRGYKRVREAMRTGRLANVPFVFPNVELRVTPRVSTGGALNLHLLFSPVDPDHVVKIEEALATIKFRSGENFPCSEAGLLRLGRKFLGPSTSDAKALSEGANQFKIEVSDVLGLLESNPWIGTNCLVAIPGAKDGPSGLQKDDSYKALRDELSSIAHIIFSGNPKDRIYWLGNGVDPVDELVRRFRGRKPCLHGSDAHAPDVVLNPPLQRYCWIRAAPTWDGFKQVLHEPEHRVVIAPDPPARLRANWIRSVRVTSTGWFPRETLELNDGLVAIIGPRGSGKTALADLIAFGADAYDNGNDSFLAKAGELARGTAVELAWGDDRETSPKDVGDEPLDEWLWPPQVRYLSQHFVETLCSDSAGSDRLVREIEKVVFERLDPRLRSSASTFAELRDLETDSIRRRIDQVAEQIRECTAAIGRDNEMKRTLPDKHNRLAAMDAEIASRKKDRDALVTKVDPEQVKRLESVNANVSAAGKRVADLSDKLRRIRDLRRDLAAEAARVGELNKKWQALVSAIGVAPWDATLFALRFEGDTAPILDAREAELVLEQKTETGEGLEPAAYVAGSYAAQKRELDALQKSMAADTAKQKQFAELCRAITALEETRKKLADEIQNASMADGRMAHQRDKRLQLYREVFAELGEEERLLGRLYAPLHEWLKGESEAERKLEFYVRRRVDIHSWAERGEALLDLRKKGPLNDRGALAKLAEKHMLAGWRTGDLVALETGMKALLSEIGNWRELLAPKASPTAFGDWLFSTDHIRLTYGIRYGGTELNKLSPGTRGIVLLVLYLAIDQADDSPLIVDQPEENLDPQSIFTELVGYFRRARSRRQVIIVTHNPNLVVNTDADQVIIASCERTSANTLPQIRYTAGPIESPRIRAGVCQILEGGEEAFRRREKRYELRR